MGDFNSAQTAGISDSGYLYDAIPPENVFGHTKKVRLFREAIEQVRRASGRESLRVLDIGCGSGHAVTRFLGKTGDKVLGIDMYPPNIAYANAHFRQDGLSFACMDARSLSADECSFDVVVMADVLEHLADPAKIIAVAVELLVPGGRLLVTVPNGIGPFEVESALSRMPVVGAALLRLTDLFVAALNKSLLKGAWSRAAAVVPGDLPYNIDSGHVQFFKRAEMDEMLTSAGLRVLGLCNLSFLSGPFTNYLFAPSRTFCEWNARVVDRLSPWLSSAWFIECGRVGGED